MPTTVPGTMGNDSKIIFDALSTIIVYYPLLIITPWKEGTLFIDFSTIYWTSILTIALWIKCYYHFPVTDDEVEAQKNSGTCLETYKWVF